MAVAKGTCDLVDRLRDYEVVAEVIRSLLLTMEKLKIATSEEVELETLAQRLGKEVAANRGVIVAPSLIGAWAHKPDEGRIESRAQG